MAHRVTVGEESRQDSDTRNLTPAQLAADPALTGTYVGLGALAPTPRPAAPVLRTVVTTLQSGNAFSATGTGASGGADTTNYALGTQSFYGLSNGAGAAVNIKNSSGSTYDITGKIIRVVLMVDQPAKLNNITVLAGDLTLANRYNLKVASGNDVLMPNEWTTIHLSMTNSTTTGTPNKAATVGWDVQYQDNSTATPVKVWVNEISLVTPSTAFPNGVVTLSFDDSYVDSWSLAKPRMDLYGYRGTLFPIIGNVGSSGSYLTTTQIDEMVKQGWEVGGHATTAAIHTSRLSTLSAAAVDAELRACKAWAEANGWGPCNSFAYPGGLANATMDYTAAVSTNAKRYYSVARTAAGYPWNTCLPVDSPMRIRALQFSTAAAGIAAVDLAYTNGDWLNYYWHAVTASELNTFVDYLNTKGIPVRTMAEVVRAVA